MQQFLMADRQAVQGIVWSQDDEGTFLEVQCRNKTCLSIQLIRLGNATDWLLGTIEMQFLNMCWNKNRLSAYYGKDY